MDVIRTETFALEAHAQLLFFKACAFWRYACTICTMQAHPQLCLPTMMKIIGQHRPDFRWSRVLSIMPAYRGLGRTPQGSNDMHSCWLTSHLFLCARFWRGLSIALVIVRNRQWLGVMECLIVMSAFALVLGRRCTPRGHDNIARWKCYLRCDELDLMQ